MPAVIHKGSQRPVSHGPPKLRHIFFNSINIFTDGDLAAVTELLLQHLLDDPEYLLGPGHSVCKAPITLGMVPQSPVEVSVDPQRVKIVLETLLPKTVALHVGQRRVGV